MWLSLLLSGTLLATAAKPARSGSVRSIEFNRDIRPILSDKCYTCHGPDKGARLGALRLDRGDSALSDLGDGRRAIVPGDPSPSEFIHRVTATEEVRRMPPVYTRKTVTPGEIALLSGWIEQGAKWQPHCSFIPPQRPALPAVAKNEWPRNPIDSFVLARLDQDGREPSPEAGRKRYLAGSVST